jgi:hypothetical protein
MERTYPHFIARLKVGPPLLEEEERFRISGSRRFLYRDMVPYPSGFYSAVNGWVSQFVCLQRRSVGRSVSQREFGTYLNNRKETCREGCRSRRSVSHRCSLCGWVTASFTTEATTRVVA